MNSNTKTIVLTLLATSIVAVGATLASSTWNINNQDQNLNSKNIVDFWFWKKWMMGEWRWMMMWWMWDFSHGFGFKINELTTEEKTKLESMTDDEKKAFFESKKLEIQAKIESHENVIDKLLAGQTLSSDEEKIRAEIIKQRAEMKLKKQEMEEIKNLINKQRNWETLTTDEQTKFDEFKSQMPKKRWWKWFWRNN